jgi:hypothetical protein
MVRRLSERILPVLSLEGTKGNFLLNLPRRDSGKITRKKLLEKLWLRGILHSGREKGPGKIFGLGGWRPILAPAEVLHIISTQILARVFWVNEGHLYGLC